MATSQAAYYLATGTWPLVSRRTFEAVTGPKHDYWLVQTVGALVSVAGATLGLAARDNRALGSPTVTMLGVGSALSLAAIDVAFVVRRRISPIYLVDAAGEIALVLGWLLAGRSLRTRGL